MTLDMIGAKKGKGFPDESVVSSECPLTEYTTREYSSEGSSYEPAMREGFIREGLPNQSDGSSERLLNDCTTRERSSEGSTYEPAMREGAIGGVVGGMLYMWGGRSDDHCFDYGR